MIGRLSVRPNHRTKRSEFQDSRGFHPGRAIRPSPISILRRPLWALSPLAGGLLFVSGLLIPTNGFGQLRTADKVKGAPKMLADLTAQATPAPKVDYGETKEPKSTTSMPALGPPQALLSLSLSDSIRMGLARNFQIRMDRLNPRIQAQDVTREDAEFDTVGFANGGLEEALAPSNSSLGMVRRTETDEQTLNVGIRRRYKTGTSYELRTGLNKSNNNAQFIRLNPAVEPQFSLSLTQNLLKNFGRDVNSTAIRVAQNDQAISASQYRDSVINVVTDIENFYWELVFAIEELEVKKKSLTLAQDLLRRNKIQVEVGTLAPLEIVQAQASVASREAEVITAERQVRDNDDRLKRALNLPSDITSWNTRIRPKDLPKVIRRVPDVRKSFAIALKNRPDYQQAKIDLESRNIQTQFAKNQLLPTLDLTGSIALNGLGRDFAEAVDELGQGEYYQWAVGFTFEFPFSNRSSRSRLTQRKLETAQALLGLKNLEQQIFLEVREAVRAILTAQKQVDSTRAARILAERQLDAEEKKFAVGLSTNFQVLTFQDDLSTARSAETRAIIDQIESLVNFRKVTGQTLLANQIQLEGSARPR